MGGWCGNSVELIEFSQNEEEHQNFHILLDMSTAIPFPQQACLPTPNRRYRGFRSDGMYPR